MGRAASSAPTILSQPEPAGYEQLAQDGLGLWKFPRRSDRFPIAFSDSEWCGTWRTRADLLVGPGEARNPEGCPYRDLPEARLEEGAEFWGKRLGKIVDDHLMESRRVSVPKSNPDRLVPVWRGARRGGLR